jgi:sodium transport system ATP-binding protein
MLRAEELRKVFRTPRAGVVEAVRGATFAVAAGEVFGLLGPNGAGKTTLLRMLATIIVPSSGRCFVNGVAADEEPDQIRASIGFLSGNTRLYGRLTGREVLHYFGRLYGMREAEIRRRTDVIAALLDMGGFINRRCDTLSTGQTQKVSIARVILHDPKVLILDEPTLGLDIMTSAAILSFISDARARGRAIIFSTHYMSEAEQLCDRVGLLHKGDLFAVDSKAALCARTDTPDLRGAFLKLVGEREPSKQ